MDVTQFVRLEQCERYLRFRLAERAGQKFMEDYDVIPQRITPLLSLSGHTFEEGIETDLAKRLPTVNYAVKYGKSHNRPENNNEVVQEARKLLPSQAVLLFQPRLEAELGGWRLRGDVDLLRLERTADGTLHVFIGDMKSTVEVKVEHRLQVAFYRLMLERILKDGGISHNTVQTGILYRPPADPTPEDEEEIKPLREAAKQVFGFSGALLEVIADQEAYLQSAHDLVLGKESTARRVAGTPFEAIPYCLSFKCDGCLYNEFRMKWSAEKEDLSLLPYMTGTDKEAMRRVGVTTVQSLATLKDFVPDLNPNLVRIYLDAQQDYLEDRVYLVGALVVACKDGTPVAKKAVVKLMDGPPDTVAKERQLFVGWTRELVKAVVDLAVSGVPAGEKKSAPIHVIFFDRHEQRVMLEALARNFPPILKNTPPLYDFLTQIAAFDSPIASFLDEEMRTFKNFPMTCQSLQSVAQYLKFDWNTPHKFREAFKARLFDNIGKMDIDGTSEWYTRRSRFSSSVPLEYAYAAWGQLPTPAAGRGDEFADFRGVTKDLLTAFQVRRLEALEHVANSVYGNPNTQKTPFVLPDLAKFEDKADDLAHALHEFVTIERMVELNDWKATRHAPPERRVLMGDCLLVRYCEEDQEPGVAEQNRENERRRQKREE